MREVKWWGSTKDDLAALPTGVRKQFGTKLTFVRQDQPISGTYPWKGFGPGAKEFKSSQYRMVLTTEFSGFVDVLNVFKKAGPGGKKTSKQIVELTSKRYADACAEHAPRDKQH